MFVHGFHERPLRVAEDALRSQGASFDWRSHVLAWCDAGAGRFGVVYDPRARTFGRLEFNSGFGGPVTY